MQHDMRFETSHSGEFLVTHRTGGVLPIVGTLMKCQVEFNIKRLGALVTSVWLCGEKRQEATETPSFHSEAAGTSTGATVRTALPADTATGRDRQASCSRSVSRGSRTPVPTRAPPARLPVGASGCRGGLHGNEREPCTAAIRPFLSASSPAVNGTTLSKTGHQKFSQVLTELLMAV